tara:strand:+ start:5311 stop:5856 length:546 start_codon:yes stop_codon:yes gene_type:complete
MVDVSFVKYHNIVVPSAVKNSFADLAVLVRDTLGFTIEPVDGYRTEKEILNELKARVKDRESSKLENNDWIKNLPPDRFEPPLTGNQIALRDVHGQEIVATIPNYPNIDPRTTGRIIQFGPKNLINPTLLHFLVHNAGNYGFVHYGPRDPSIWYWRGDKEPYTYNAQETVSLFTSELSYLL